LYLGTDDMTKNERPPAGVYLIIEAILILGLSYIAFISQAHTALGVKIASQAILGLTMAAWLASKLLPGWPWPRQRSWPATPLDRPLVATLAVVVLSTIFSTYPRVNLENAAYVFVCAVAFWFLYEQIQVGWFADQLFKCLLIVGGIACLFTLIEWLSWYLGLPDGPAWPSLGFGIWPPLLHRAGFQLMGCNHLAGFLAPLALLALALSLRYGTWMRRLALWAFCLLMTALVVLTQSRGGLLGLMAGLGIVVVGSWPRLRQRWPRLRPTWRRWTAAGIALFGICALSMLKVYQLRGIGKGITLITRETDRLHFWTVALRIAAEHPLLGVGPGAFVSAYLQDPDANQIFMMISQAHNIPLHILATLGVAGFLTHVWLAVALTMAAWRLWRTEQDWDHQWVRLAAMAGLAAIATHGLFDALSLQFPAVSLLAVMLTAFALRPVSPSHPPLSPPPRWWLWPTAAAVLASLGLGIAIWSDYGMAAFNRAVSASHSGDWSEAAEVLETAVRRDPNNHYYHRHLGLAYSHLAPANPAYLDKALAAYRAGAIEEQYYAPDRANFAWLLWETGQQEAGVEEMALAVHMAKGTFLPGTSHLVLARYHLNQGLMLEKLGRVEAAHTQYAQAVARFPEILSLSFWDAGHQAPRDRQRLAVTAVGLLQSSSGELSAYQRGEFAYYLHDPDEAERWLRLSLHQKEDAVSAWVLLGSIGLDTGNAAQALDAAEHILEIHPFAVSGYTLRAKAHLAGNDLDAAAADLQVLRFLAPQSPTVSLLLGHLAEAQGETDEAARHYQTAIGLSVGLRYPLATDTVPFLQRPVESEVPIPAYLALATLYARQGMTSEARDAYQTILEINPHHIEAQEGLAALP
jgi:tetratricopeptide (TPR) repeat protein/O-antigen ligase